MGHLMASKLEMVKSLSLMRGLSDFAIICYAAALQALWLEPKTTGSLAGRTASSGNAVVIAAFFELFLLYDYYCVQYKAQRRCASRINDDIVYHYQRHPAAATAARQERSDVTSITRRWRPLEVARRSDLCTTWQNDVAINRWRHASYWPASANYDH